MANTESTHLFFTFAILLLFFIIGIFGQFAETVLWIYAIVFITYLALSSQKRRHQLLSWLFFSFGLLIILGQIKDGIEFHKFLFLIGIFFLTIFGLTEFVVKNVESRVKDFKKISNENQFF